MPKSLYFLINNHARAIMLTAAVIVLAVPTFAHAQPPTSPPAAVVAPTCGNPLTCPTRIACDRAQYANCIHVCHRRKHGGKPLLACVYNCNRYKIDC